MANWSPMILTEAGKALLADAQLNKKDIVVVGVGVGAGTPSTTELGNRKYMLEVQDVYTSGSTNEVATFVSSTLVNSQKAGGFAVTELGLYVNDGNKTILYAYCTDSNPDNFPEYNGKNPVTLQYSMNFKISGTESFTATIGTDGYITVQTVNAMLDDENAIINLASVNGKLVGKHRLGNEDSISLKYAGSDSDGGAANVANKLGTSTVGSTSKPIYLKEGVATALPYSIKSSVPENAKFTDTQVTLKVW